ncbi:hypothetical protein BaRGS_00020592 [Batillaria attramentaria]|uniref:Secreted protein n=1 Tax=Batillaria attramentaria TaxID=370345 RepID=A0ABD0KMC4_9CAEN
MVCAVTVTLQLQALLVDCRARRVVRTRLKVLLSDNSTPLHSDKAEPKRGSASGKQPVCFALLSTCVKREATEMIFNRQLWWTIEDKKLIDGTV